MENNIIYQTEMVYTGVRVDKIIAEGIYRGYRWIVKNLGTHPTAYVDVKTKEHPAVKDKESDYGSTIKSHGGITYSGVFKNLEGFYLGWDYAHLGDFFQSSRPSEGKKYTTEEIIEDCKLAIDSICDIVKKDIDERKKKAMMMFEAEEILAFAQSTGHLDSCLSVLDTFKTLKNLSEEEYYKAVKELEKDFS